MSPAAGAPDQRDQRERPATVAQVYEATTQLSPLLDRAAADEGDRDREGGQARPVSGSRASSARMLDAQARLEGLTLVTRDRRITAYAVATLSVTPRLRWRGQRGYRADEHRSTT